MMLPSGLCGAPVRAGAGAGVWARADATQATVEATATSRANRATGPASRVINPHRGGRRGWDHKIGVPQYDARLSINVARRLPEGLSPDTTPVNAGRPLEAEVCLRPDVDLHAARTAGSPHAVDGSSGEGALALEGALAGS